MNHSYSHEEMHSTFGIYKIEGPKGKIYIGSTTRNFYDRLCAHISTLKKGKHSSILLQRAWLKYGATAFTFYIVEKLSDPTKSIEREIFFNCLYKSTDPKLGYNVSAVRNNRLGHRQSEQTKQKISASLIGTSKPKGFAENLSIQRTGNGNPMFGKKQSSNLVELRTKKIKKKVIRSDGEVFSSLNEAALEMSVSPQSISQSLRKGYKCMGFTFKYGDSL